MRDFPVSARKTGLREVSRAGIVVETLLFLLGEEIRSQRKARAMTQMDLADRCGLHVTFIGGVERGQRNISILSLEAIAKALGASMTELISGIEHRARR
jgi:transcriptional regulator with XRE-family HTH domain